MNLLFMQNGLPPYGIPRNGLVSIIDPWRDTYGRNILPAGSENFQTGWNVVAGETITVTDYPTTININGVETAIVAKRITGNGIGTSVIKYSSGGMNISNPHTAIAGMYAKKLNTVVSKTYLNSASAQIITSDWSFIISSETAATATTYLQFVTGNKTDALDILVYQPQVNLGTLYPYAPPAGLPQSTLDYSGHGNSLVNGSTASADTNDAAFSGVAMVHTTNQYQLSSTISTLNMSNFSLLIAGKFAGTSGAITSLAVPSVTNKYQGVKYVSSGNLAIISCNGGTESVSSNLAVSTTDNVTLLFTASGGTLTLKNLVTGASVTLTDTAPTGSPRIGMGCVAGSTVAQIASALTWYNVVPYSRVLSAAEVANSYINLKRYNNRKGVVVA